jgi:hypothetical protein
VLLSAQMGWYDAKGDPPAACARESARCFVLSKFLRCFVRLTRTDAPAGNPTVGVSMEKDIPFWSLTFRVDGRKRVERIPDEWVEQIRPLVEQGREFKDAIAEVFAANSQLLALWRKQSAKKRRKEA